MLCMAQIGYCKCNKVKDFEMDELPWIICVGPKCNHKDPYKREPRGSESVVGEMMSEVRKGPGVQEGRKPVEAEKRETFPLGATRRIQP